MSWYSGSFGSVAAGSLLAVIDTYISSHSTWSVADSAAGTNAKVYECEDDAVHFFLYIDDNHSGYAIVQLWEDWDSDSHVGVGFSRTVFSSTYTFIINRPVGSWWMSIRDRTFRFVNNSYCGTYIGGLEPSYDETKNIVLYLGESTGTNYYNCICRSIGNADGGWAVFSSQDGFEKTALATNGEGYDATYPGYGYFQFKDTVGEFHIIETNARITSYCPRLLGVLDGTAVLCSNTTYGFANGDTFTEGSNTWFIFGGGYSTKYWAAFRED